MIRSHSSSPRCSLKLVHASRTARTTPTPWVFNSFRSAMILPQRLVSRSSLQPILGCVLLYSCVATLASLLFTFVTVEHCGHCSLCRRGLDFSGQVGENPSWWTSPQYSCPEGYLVDVFNIFEMIYLFVESCTTIVLKNIMIASIPRVYSTQSF